jgi:hypothetical protein
MNASVPTESEEKNFELVTIFMRQIWAGHEISNDERIWTTLAVIAYPLYKALTSRQPDDIIIDLLYDTMLRMGMMMCHDGKTNDITPVYFSRRHSYHSTICCGRRATPR